MSLESELAADYTDFADTEIRGLYWTSDSGLSADHLMQAIPDYRRDMARTTTWWRPAPQALTWRPLRSVQIGYL